MTHDNRSQGAGDAVAYGAAQTASGAYAHAYPGPSF
jgi:hypothetical protein